ncbi:hypothetical protein PHYSODRAFT_285731 [Phytophthora sojae]|uniref:Uncharacterized protein n=1 Tax=Phytophthora sojae (strain P6497) TaxID=1094619 RepID=G4Z755_PHYSP|nr:hypothetical protein PHYSODRAFT_285731 [Phytophthora sojae]EGZ22439.1 hypothetical protein PHYSODRAFT_285731 [Phytophthora sojae]|eukprot:XP_009525156.1 hypothetical protein PHYSODRAFT_285731 [Phytophthora sojae]
MVLLHLLGLSHGLLAALLVVLALAYPGALQGEDLAHLPPSDACRYGVAGAATRGAATARSVAMWLGHHRGADRG